MRKAVSGIMLTLLFIGMLTLAFNKVLIVYAQDIVVDHQENFRIGDYWCSTKYENLPAGSTVTVSWKADLGISPGLAIGTFFLVAEEELSWMYTELYPIQSSHSLAEADIVDDVEGNFSFTLSETDNYYVWVENYAWSHLDLLGPPIDVDYYDVVRTGIHDVRISSVNLNVTEAQVGQKIGIEVEINNVGEFGESINVTTYYDDEIIESKSVWLGRWMGCLQSFVWDTADISPGSYTIKAVASPVPNETNIDDNTFVDGTVELTSRERTLTIHSVPSGVTFTIDGVHWTTPWSANYSEGTLVSLDMPETHTVGDARYYWNQWSDGNTSRTRTFTMTTDSTLTAYYTGPYYELSVTSSPITGITFTINGTPQTTPYTEWLLEGSYTLEMPETHNGYVWSHWFEDGDPDRTKTITLPGTTWTGVFVQPYGPEAEFEATPNTASTGESIKFDASASSPGWNGTDEMPIVEYRWNFGDGNSTTTSTPIIYHGFSSSGIYYVTLTVYAPGATPETDTISRKVTIISVPVGGYSFPIKDDTITKPLTLYIALVAILTVSFTMVKRRKKQQN